MGTSSLRGMSEFHTTGGWSDLSGMDVDLVRSPLFSLGWSEASAGDIVKGHPCPGMAQERDENIYFILCSRMSYTRNGCLLGHTEASSL